MDRSHIIFLLVAVSIANGIFSPAVFYLWAFTPAWYPSFLPFTLEVSLYLSSILCSTLTLMVSGVVAAGFERATGRRASDEASLWVWFAAAAVLSLPAAARVLGA